MSIRREFVDWNKPLIPEVGQRLLAAAAGTPADLRNLIVLVPGERAGRLLLGHLVRAGELADRGIIPPRTMTASRLIDSVLRARSPVDDQSPRIASSTEMHLGWVATLRDALAGQLEHIVPNPPDRDDTPGWARLARIIARVHHQLGAHMKSFSDVRRLVASRTDIPAELERWQALEAIESRYHEVLALNGLVDRDAQAARVLTTPPNQPVMPESKLCLVGVAEISELERRAIGHFADRTTCFVHSEPALQDHFDDLGSIVADHWLSRPCALDEDAIQICPRNADQPQALLEMLAELGSEFSAGDIIIGLGDEALAPSIQQQCRWAGVSTHIGPGRALTDSPPVQLLRLIADWLDDHRFACLGAMLRHPDFERAAKAIAKRGLDDDDDEATRAIGGWVRLLDDYFAQTLQQHCTGEWLSDDRTRHRLGVLFDAVNELLQPLADDQPRSLREWARPIATVLASVYGGSTRATAARTFDACMALRDVLENTAQASAELQPLCTARQALRWLVDAVSQQTIPDAFEDDQLQMLGWLELHADPAPVLFIAGMNEGAVPAAPAPDGFLPDSLRGQLGLPTNASRHARDAYLLEAVTRCRQHVRITCARTADDDEPLAMSRLLLQCDDETMLDRVRRFHGLNVDAAAHRRRPPIGLPNPAAESRFTIPDLPSHLPAVEKMSVTDFKSWLFCPYRFVLSKLLRLKAVDSLPQPEFTALHFGNILHHVLEAFACDPTIVHLEDPARLERELHRLLEEHAAEQFGTTRSTAVAVQLAQARQRLRAFAFRQAELRAEGWRIMHAEHEISPETTALDVPGEQPMPISGRIDRIDVHEDKGVFRIIDYKTGERGEDPVKAHHGTTKVPDPLEWRDLQLPLYHHLMSQRTDLIESGAPIEVGYFVLPRKAEDVSMKLGPWHPDQLADALNLAQSIVRDVRAGRFERSDASPWWDDYARLCQAGVIGGVQSAGQGVPA